MPPSMDMQHASTWMVPRPIRSPVYPVSPFHACREKARSPSPPARSSCLHHPVSSSRITRISLMKRLEGGIVYNQAPQLRFFRFVFRPVGCRFALFCIRLILFLPRRAPKFVFLLVARVVL